MNISNVRISHDFIKYPDYSNLINIRAVICNPLIIGTGQIYCCLLDIKQLTAKKSSNELLDIPIIKSFLTLNEYNNIDMNFPSLENIRNRSNMLKS